MRGPLFAEYGKLYSMLVKLHDTGMCAIRVCTSQTHSQT